jgi:hypothetical protein
MTRLVLDHGLNIFSGSLDIEEAINIAVGKANFPLFKLLLDSGLLDSPSASPGDRNILGIEIPAPPVPQKDTNTDATTVNLPADHGAYSEPITPPLVTSPLDHLFMSQAVPGPGNTDIFRSVFVRTRCRTSWRVFCLYDSIGNSFKTRIYPYSSMLRVIDRQTITEEEFLLKLGVLPEIDPPDAVARSSYAEYYAKRSSRDLP